MERTLFLIIILIGIGMAALMSVVNGTWQATNFADYHDDAEIYNRTALAILERGSFHEEGDLTVGAFRRAPGYPLFLAFSYAIFGKTPVSILIMQGIIFVASLILLWSIASAHFPYPWRLLPSFLFSLLWFLPLQVTIIIPELFSLFLLLVMIWSFERFFTSHRVAWIALAGAALAWFILIKPIALYILPFVILVWIFRDYAAISPARLTRVIALFLSVPLLAVGAWTARSIHLFHTWQIQSGSYVVGWKSLEATQPWQRVGASFIGGLVGDLIADRIILPGYAANPEPYQHVKTIFTQMRTLEAQGFSETEKEKILYREARGRIASNPLKFFIAGITGLLRQNTPMNHRGEAITHLFASGGYEFFSSSQKALILVILRLVWYFLLFLIAWGIALHYKQWRAWGMVIVWIVLYNLFYGFFTHNEARYLIPIWPLYLLFLTAALMHIFNRYGKKLRTALSQS